MGVLKNILLTALMVVGATMATAGVAAVAVMFISLREAPGDQSNTFVYGGYAIAMMAAVVGAFFAVVPLALAAVTMPPAIGLMRLAKLPRPLFDIFGGAAVGLLCSAAAAAMLESLARSKGGDWGENYVPVVLDICALLGGGALGYLRHAVLVKKHEEPALPQFA